MIEGAPRSVLAVRHDQNTYKLHCAQTYSNDMQTCEEGCGYQVIIVSSPSAKSRLHLSLFKYSPVNSRWSYTALPWKHQVQRRDTPQSGIWREGGGILVSWRSHSPYTPYVIQSEQTWRGEYNYSHAIYIYYNTVQKLHD